MIKKIFILTSFVFLFAFTAVPVETEAVARDSFPSGRRTQPLPVDTQPNISENIQSDNNIVAPGLLVEEPKENAYVPEAATGKEKTSRTWIWWTILGTLAIILIIARVIRGEKIE
ncbi:MAG: hypothetical protein KA052_01335 [Candidatus Pacebacteria bacterium]|nr:hypothetical protein [Candidatus Paceibacterota bacterium]